MTRGSMPRPGDDKVYLEHARQWLPYGGASAENIYVTFGVGAAAYYIRLARIVAFADMAEIERDRLLALCNRNRR